MNCPECNQSDEPVADPGIEVNSTYAVVWIHSVRIWDDKGPRSSYLCMKCGHRWAVPFDNSADA